MNHSNSFMIQAVISIFTAALLFTSCEKNESADNNPALTNTDGKCLLLPPTVSIAPFGSDASATRSGEEAKPEEVRFNVGEELGNILTIENTPEADTPATRALAAGTYFQMVIYKKSDWDSKTMTITEQRLCKIGSDNYYDTSGNQITAPVLLAAGSYKVFCYSFNKTDTPIPELTNKESGVTVQNEEDFLSQVADLTITTESNQISLPLVTLKHRCCKITGKLAIDAFESDIRMEDYGLWITATVPGNGSWNIVDGNMEVFSEASKKFQFNMDYESDHVTTSSGSLILLPMTSQITYASYYIILDNVGSSPRPDDIDVTDQPLSTTPTTFTPGSNHTFTVTAIDAYVLSSEPIEIGGVMWATSNLQGTTATNEDKPWISGFCNGYTALPESGTGTVSNNSKNDYWRWNRSSIDIVEADPALSSTWEENNDPCKSKLKDKWRIPTIYDFSNLAVVMLNRKRVYINDEVKQTNEWGWLVTSGYRVSGTVFFKGNDLIFFPAVGLRLGANCYEISSHGYYWSSNSYDSSNQSYTLVLNSDDYANLSLNFTNRGYNLRCVKDK